MPIDSSTDLCIADYPQVIFFFSSFVFLFKLLFFVRFRCLSLSWCFCCSDSCILLPSQNDSALRKDVQILNQKIKYFYSFFFSWNFSHQNKEHIEILIWSRKKMYESTLFFVQKLHVLGRREYTSFMYGFTSFFFWVRWMFLVFSVSRLFSLFNLWNNLLDLVAVSSKILWKQDVDFVSRIIFWALKN